MDTQECHTRSAGGHTRSSLLSFCNVCLRILTNAVLLPGGVVVSWVLEARFKEMGWLRRTELPGAEAAGRTFNRVTFWRVATFLPLVVSRGSAVPLSLGVKWWWCSVAAVLGVKVVSTSPYEEACVCGELAFGYETSLPIALVRSGAEIWCLSPGKQKCSAFRSSAWHQGDLMKVTSFKTHHLNTSF